MSTLAPPAPPPTRFRRTQPWISTVLRLALAAVWLVAGGLKVSFPRQSALAVQAYELPLPQWLITAIGWGLPWFEVILGLVLLAGLVTRPAAVVSAVVLSAYVVVAASAWARGLAIDCGCFGGGGQVAPADVHYLWQILRDTGFLILAGWLIRYPRSHISLDRVTDDEENS